MAEVILNRKGFPNFTGYSAGSRPTGRIDPQAVKQITSAGLPVEGLRSKNWNEFEKPDAPKIHFVFNLCDRAGDEPCPVWPGQPLTARWSIPDPAAATGADEQIQRAYFESWRILDRRIALFICLPLETLERDVMQREIDQIGLS